jgi:hypothetical protein
MSGLNLPEVRACAAAQEAKPKGIMLDLGNGAWYSLDDLQQVAENQKTAHSPETAVATARETLAMCQLIRQLQAEVTKLQTPSMYWEHGREDTPLHDPEEDVSDHRPGDIRVFETGRVLGQEIHRVIVDPDDAGDGDDVTTELVQRLPGRQYRKADEIGKALAAGATDDEAKAMLED